MAQTISSSGPAPLSTRQMVRAPALQLYMTTLRALEAARVPFVVGGAFALRHYAGIARDTKDLDIFLRRRDLDAAFAALHEHGFATDLTFPHWLGKAHQGEHFVDFIFDSANGMCPVDDAWFTTAPLGVVFGMPVLLCPIEEVIWTKCFVMERERFDGADVCHLIEAQGHAIDWRRLLDRFGDKWRILLGHLAFFSFVYPAARDRVPAWVMDELVGRLRRGLAPEQVDVCRGTLISREQYLVDLRERGYEDARIKPHGPCEAKDIAWWTTAIGKIK
jgi:hypothetical protein